MTRDGGQQQLHRDGLAHESGNGAVHHQVSTGGEDQHGHGGEFRGFLALVQELPAVHHRHHQIEQDELRRRGVVVEPLERIAPVAHRLDGVAGIVERLLHRLA